MSSIRFVVKRCKYSPEQSGDLIGLLIADPGCVISDGDFHAGIKQGSHKSDVERNIGQLLPFTNREYLDITGPKHPVEHMKIQVSKRRIDDRPRAESRLDCGQGVSSIGQSSYLFQKDFAQQVEPGTVR